MNKNSMRLLVAVGVLALVACSWFTLISDTQKANAAYMTELNTARSKVENGLYEVALEYYDKAMKLRDSIELRDEMAQVYQDHASGSAYESFCEDLLNDYPKEVRPYERLALLYRDTEAFDACFDLMETAQKRGLKSDVLETLKKELAYAYDLERSAAVTVSGSFSAGYCAVQYKSGYWGFVNGLGTAVASGAYYKVSPFSTAGCAITIDKEGKAAVINVSGKQLSLSKNIKVEDCTALIGGKMAVKYNGKYHYCDAYFKELFGEYDYAGSFGDGVAAVMVGSKWAIINESGNKVTEFVFDDIKLDDQGIAFRDGKGFAKKDGNYIMIDTKGNQVGNESWQDVDAFNSDKIAAVMKNGKWGFVNSAGSLVVDYTYSNAKSFSNGMAAVALGDKWGYISATDYALKIEATFAEAYDFSRVGTAFVKNGDQYRLLRIYSLT